MAPIGTKHNPFNLKTGDVVRSHGAHPIMDAEYYKHNIKDYWLPDGVLYIVDGVGHDGNQALVQLRDRNSILLGDHSKGHAYTFPAARFTKVGERQKTVPVQCSAFTKAEGDKPKAKKGTKFRLRYCKKHRTIHVEADAAKFPATALRQWPDVRNLSAAAIILNELDAG